MTALDSMAARASGASDARSLAVTLALLLGVIQVGWLGLLLWAACRIVGAI